MYVLCICLHRIAADERFSALRRFHFSSFSFVQYCFVFQCKVYRFDRQFCSNNYACNVWIFADCSTAAHVYIVITLLFHRIFASNCFFYSLRRRSVAIVLWNSLLSFACMQAYCFQCLWWFGHDHDCPRASKRSMHFLLLNWKRNSIDAHSKCLQIMSSFCHNLWHLLNLNATSGTMLPSINQMQSADRRIQSDCQMQ